MGDAITIVLRTERGLSRRMLEQQRLLYDAALQESIDDYAKAKTSLNYFDLCLRCGALAPKAPSQRTHQCLRTGDGSGSQRGAEHPGSHRQGGQTPCAASTVGLPHRGTAIKAQQRIHLHRSVWRFWSVLMADGGQLLGVLQQKAIAARDSLECPACQAIQARTAKFCSDCGGPLKAAVPGDGT